MRTQELKCNHMLLPAVLLFSWTVCVSAQVPLGSYSGHRVSGKAVTVFAGASAVRLLFYADDLLRVDFLPDSTAEPDSTFVVIRDTMESVPVSITEDDSTLTISSPGIAAHCRKFPLRFTYRDGSGGALLREPASGGLSADGASRWAVFALHGDEHFYGTGERGTGPDLRGQVLDVWNTQVYGYHEPVATMKVNVPFLASSHGYALYFDNTWRGRFDLGGSDPGKFWYIAEGGELTFYLIAAPTLASQLERYTWLTGRQPLPPRWALGFIQSKFGYQNETEARSVIATMRQKRIPCDALVLDLYWFEHMGDLSWNAARWPSPFLMMSDFRAQGVRTIAITEPYIVQPSLNFGIAGANGYLARNELGAPYILQNWWSCGCPAGLLDITNPDARTWWWSLHPPFMGSTMAGLWTDLGEPERHPEDMRNHLGPAARIHNIFNLLWAKTIFEGHAQTFPNRRIMNLTRSGFAGIQRYGAITWSGDVGKSFGGLAVQVPIMIGAGLSGLAYHNSDLGGFCCGTTTPELYVRWMQFGALGPVMRAHGASQPTEPWAFGLEAEAIVTSFIELRYRLLPYLYTLAAENTATGMPLARPLVMEDPALAGEHGSYLLGDALLVSPVVADGQRTKTVLLPAGRWADFWSDTVYQGGTPVTVPAPLERIPLFVRAGSIIPMGPVMQYTDERPLDTLSLAVAPSLQRTARFTLYEDDGVSLAYETGARATTLFEAAATAGDSGTTLSLSIGRCEGTFAGKLERRVHLAEVHGVASPPAAVRRDGLLLPLRLSYAELRAGGNGYFHDPSLRRLYIHLPVHADSQTTVVAEALALSAGGPDLQAAPASFTLDQNFPNPFNPATTLSFTLPAAGRARLSIVSLLGEEVATVVDSHLSAGPHTYTWVSGGLSTGVYFGRLEFTSAGGERLVETRKLVLLR